MGAIMYALANIDFSNRLGVVVSELPDEIDDQHQTPDAKQQTVLSNLEMAPFLALLRQREGRSTSPPNDS